MRIARDQCGIVLRGSEFIKVVGPGYHFLPGFRVVLHRRKGWLNSDVDLNLLMQVLGEENPYLEFKVVPDGHISLAFEDDRYFCRLTAGKYAFWKGLYKYTYVDCDMNEPEIPAALKRDWLRQQGIVEHVQVLSVPANCTGALFINRAFVRLLEPGDYAFWKHADAAEVVHCDMRMYQTEVSGQELLTRDHITLRINYMYQWKVADPEKVLRQIMNPTQQLYAAIQLALREFVGSVTLDELLARREEIGKSVTNTVRPVAGNLGYELESGGAKDIILPGEIREIMNRVLLAEKQAQANLIQRREETASTRSLMNTAKLMENNPLLLRLKELESMEKIVEKVQEIRLAGGGTLLEQMGALFLNQEKAKP